jgi:sugar lactone lactonase YvrE
MGMMHGKTRGSSRGGAAAMAAQLANPTGVATDRLGNLYIADTGNQRIRKVSVNGIMSTFAGNPRRDSVGNWIGEAAGDGGAATNAQLGSPVGVAVDVSGNVYIGEVSRIRKVSSDGTIRLFRNGDRHVP